MSRSSPLRLDAFLPYRLSFTAGLVSEHVASSYAEPFDLSTAEWRVLAWVAESDGITQQQICARTRMDKVSVSRAATLLADRGLLKRRAHPQDGRARQLVLSEAGVQLHAAIAPRVLAVESAILHHFTAEEADAFAAMLRRIDRVVLDMAGEAAPAPPPEGSGER